MLAKSNVYILRYRVKGQLFITNLFGKNPITVEALYYGHQGDRNKCPYYRGVRLREVGFISISVSRGPSELSVIEWCPYYRGDPKERFDCILTGKICLPSFISGDPWIRSTRWGGPWTQSTGVVHGPGPRGGPWTGSTWVVHGPGSMFCIRPAKVAFVLLLKS